MRCHLTLPVAVKATAIASCCFCVMNNHVFVFDDRVCYLLVNIGNGWIDN